MYAILPFRPEASGHQGLLSPARKTLCVHWKNRNEPENK
jgi:hypothetical protein